MTDSRAAEDYIDLAEELDNGAGAGRRGAKGGRGRAGGRGGRGARAGGSGGGVMTREVAISKALSKLLRHAAVDAGLKLDPEGFAKVDQVVSFLSLTGCCQTSEFPCVLLASCGTHVHMGQKKDLLNRH